VATTLKHDKNIYSPIETAMLGKKLAMKAAEHSEFGIELDIAGTSPAVKEYFAPLLPWEICAVQAQTSNGKTLFTNFWERQIAEQLKRQKRDEIIIHVSGLYLSFGFCGFTNRCFIFNKLRCSSRIGIVRVGV